MLVETLIEIAKEVEKTDPIDWSGLTISPEEAYRLVALSVVEKFDANMKTTTDKELIMLSSIVKLIVENMILHQKLLTR